MRVMSKVMAVLVLVTAFGDSGLGASNCGFLTLEQCRASVSGMFRNRPITSTTLLACVQQGRTYEFEASAYRNTCDFQGAPGIAH